MPTLPAVWTDSITINQAELPTGFSAWPGMIVSTTTWSSSPAANAGVGQHPMPPGRSRFADLGVERHRSRRPRRRSLGGRRPRHRRRRHPSDGAGGGSHRRRGRWK
jgi:hypothetical protein